MAGNARAGTVNRRRRCDVSDTDDTTAAPATPALGPGDDDPRSPASTSAAGAAAPPLGPGDDDPRSPATGTAAIATPPLAPGDADGDNPDDDFDFIAPPPAGPGATATVRQTVRIPKRRARRAAAADVGAVTVTE
jgi:hypothetical protein